MRVFAQVLFTFGLVLHIAGVLLVFKFWLSPQGVRRGGVGVLLRQGDDQEEAKRAQLLDCLSQVGAPLIILGFILQIMAL